MTPRISGGLLAAAAALACAPVLAAGGQANALYQFNEKSGYSPGAGVIAGPDGTLYGTTTEGGTGTCNGGKGCGTVYALTPPAGKGGSWKYQKLYDFQGGTDGAAPSAPLTLGPGGVLYGYTAGLTPGSVFRLTPPATKGQDWQFDVIYVFQDKKDGNLIGIHAPLVMNKEEVVGIAAGGKEGCGTTGCGSVFGLKEEHDGTWSQLTIHGFTGTDDSGLPNWLAAGGSQAPVAVTTSLGRGAVVALIPPGLHGLKWEMKIIATFAGGKDGSAPTNLMADSSGTFYGTASQTSGGMVFALKPPSFLGTKWRRTTVAEIDQHGAGPVSLAFDGKGTIVGAVQGADRGYAGAVFQLDAPSGRHGKWSTSWLWSFSQGPDRNPLNVIPGYGSPLYGVLQGGNSGSGTLFDLSSK